MTGPRPDPVPALDLEAALTTTRAVRRRLDLTRDVPAALIDECLELAQQAPSGGNRQSAVFVVVRDAGLRRALADLYRRGWRRYLAEGVGQGAPARTAAGDPAAQGRIAASARHLAENLERVPVHVIPCVRPRTDATTVVTQASTFGSVVPAAWSYMLAARARGLGTVYTTIHLFEERAAAALLGIPDDYMQVGLIPTAYTRGTRFRPGPRRPLETFRRVDGWDAP